MRKLRLKKETVAELTTVELANVLGGAGTVKTLKACEPTLSLTCTSEVDACLTARGCTMSLDVC
ncbi:MAG TPA: class I lanthipeptide [Frankiaceae bacterium]|nr:class I lanthipeptide [Frankiaceae bacterium]